MIPHEIRKMRAMTIYDVNNAYSHFALIFMRKEGLKEISPRWFNQHRYAIIDCKGIIPYIFLKFSREPYRTAEGGYSETINADAMRRCIALFNEGKLDRYFAVHGNGSIYFCPIEKFLKEGYKETDMKENKEKYVLNWNKFERYE